MDGRLIRIISGFVNYILDKPFYLSMKSIYKGLDEELSGQARVWTGGSTHNWPKYLGLNLA